MRQVVVLEPAGSVLVIRQTSLGSNVATGNANSNAGSNNAHETHGLANHAAVSTIASNDHNQNRIVVVRSSSSTCMTTTVSRLIRSMVRSNQLGFSYRRITVPRVHYLGFLSSSLFLFFLFFFSPPLHLSRHGRVHGL